MAENKPKPGFEESDVSVFAVGKVGVALLLATIVAMALIVGVFKYLQATTGGVAKTTAPRAVFPQPQLEERPAIELHDALQPEKDALSSYGWVDQQKGTVRIPIDQAMDMVVKKGMPVRPATPPNVEGMSQPTESGLGPKMQPPGGPLGEGK